VNNEINRWLSALSSKQKSRRDDVGSRCDVIMTWNDNRKSVSTSIVLSILVAGVTLLTSLVPHVTQAAGHRLRAASPAAAAASLGSRESVLEYFLIEELRPPAFVGNIVTDYGLERRHLPSVVSQLRFRFLSHTTPSGRQFPTSVVQTACKQYRDVQGLLDQPAIIFFSWPLPFPV